MLVLNLDNGVYGEPQVPCYFIFDDSLVKNGNNNNINSLAKANYLPYGVDYPGGPSGRFSNGKTTVDVIGLDLHSFLSIPLFLSRCLLVNLDDEVGILRRMPESFALLNMHADICSRILGVSFIGVCFEVCILTMNLFS